MNTKHSKNKRADKFFDRFKVLNFKYSLDELDEELMIYLQLSDIPKKRESECQLDRLIETLKDFIKKYR